MSQIIGQAQETLLPYILYKRRKIAIKKIHEKELKDDTSNFQIAVNQSEIEKDKDLYIDTEVRINKVYFLLFF